MGALHDHVPPEATARASERSPGHTHDPAFSISEQEESAAESGPLDEDDRLAMGHDFFSFRVHHRAIAAKNTEQQPGKSASREDVMGIEEETRSLSGTGKGPSTSSNASSRSASAPSTPHRRQSITAQQNASSTVTPRKGGRSTAKRQT